MPTSANHGIVTPEPSDLATIPAHLTAMANKIDSELDAIAPDQISGVGAGQLLVANASGVVVPRTITGDATISDTGLLKIGATKVDTAELKDNAVSSAKIAAGAVIRDHIPKTFIQTKRLIILNQAAGSAVEHTVNWDTPFASTGYTVVASLLNSTSTAAGLRVVRFVSKQTTYVKLIVENTGAIDSATLSVMAIRD